jgi:hypothetical protein
MSAIETTLERELRAAHLAARETSKETIGALDLALLPDAAWRYMNFMGVRGRPRDWSFRMASVGRFRMRAGGSWMPCEAWQYNSGVELARVFVMNMHWAGVVPMTARDTYVRGHGRMVGKLLDLITVADGESWMLDQAELVTWLNDAVLIAPSMLLRPEVTWEEVNGDAFDLTLSDGGLTVRARVTVDSNGAPTHFATEDRFRYEPAQRGRPWVRERWTTPVAGWQLVQGRRLSTFGRAVWHDDFVYAEFQPRPETLEFNVPPPA